MYYAASDNIWQSRRVQKRYIVTPGPRVSQVQRVFTFLVESGMVYCTLWIFVLAWQVGKYKGIPSHPGDNSFWDIFSIVIDGALVPLIGIYPTVIIVVVALNRSYVENSFTKASLDSSVYPLPLPPLAVAVNTTVVTRCDSQPGGRSETVLVIGEEKDSPAEGSSTHTTEERTSKDIA
ncbi:hypothetical protein GSI_03245 [Ganoderma sinense ZZ0214-1]|uniref:Uncharacterized protein n=1 Tax=Ganoderma sinense ZZ0214-1 TaxID=1077348 RepID=A0A2G8SL37_9APHY|nr:hypothetical protein GSI_03245 [Ganoderma sinense ZZ0214-1]